MNSITVLSIEDDVDFQHVINYGLSKQGFKVIRAVNARTAAEKVEQYNIDIILLDLGLPDMNGADLIPELKSKSRAGIIVFSGNSSTEEKINCLEIGAHDYVVKPVNMKEIGARIEAVFRRVESVTNAAPANEKNQKIIEFGDDWRLDRNNFQVFDKNGQSANLTPSEFEVLEALMSKPNIPLSRQELFDATRQQLENEVGREIDVQIARLRKKLSSEYKKNELIRTIHGKGYMFVGKIR